jgi:prepilin-type N-terminal cleavage/methylation domain-containing protein
VIRRRRRAGFTFIEMLIVMIIVGLLSSVAVPKYIDLKRRASTTRVVGDINAVRVAALSFYADSGYFPGEADAGEIPDNMVKYLPIGFTFHRPGWTLDYEYWDIGQSPFSNSTSIVAVAVIPEDPKLAESTFTMLGRGVPAFVNGDVVTFVISGL